MEVKILKLVNGDDIISGIKKDGLGKIVLHNPAKMMMFPSEDGMGLALVPWCPYTNQEEFSIVETHVVTYIDAPDELLNEYNNKFGSGIIAPPKKGIII